MEGLNNVLQLASKIAGKEFFVRDFDIKGIETDSKYLTITSINQMLMVIPNDKFEIHIVQIKE